MDESRKSVVVIGGGIAGLATAHLLRQAGLAVTVIEASDDVGGQARSGYTNNNEPTEHSVRGYHTDYHCLSKLLADLRDAGLVNSELNLAPIDLMGQFNGFSIFLDRKNSRARNVWSCFKSLLSQKIRFFELLRLVKLFCLQLVCEQRLISRYDYLPAEAVFKTKTSSEIWTQMFFNSACASTAIQTDSSAVTGIAANQLALEMMRAIKLIKMFNGPTSVSMLHPWKNYLEARGVRFQLGVSVNELTISDGIISGCILSDGTGEQFDHYVLAANYHAVEKILDTSHLLEQSGIDTACLNRSFEWASGAQFYLKSLPTHNANFRPGVFTAFLSSPCNLIAIIQGEGFWTNFGKVSPQAHIISTSFTNFFVPGLYNKPLVNCSREEIKEELLAQLGILDKEIVLDWHLDTSLQYLNQEEVSLRQPIFCVEQNGLWFCNDSPNLSPGRGYYHSAPKAKTPWANLHLAGVYCKTAYKLPSMEKAAESGYHAANSVLQSLNANQRIKIPYTYNTLHYSLFRRMDAKIYEWYLKLFAKN
ncbi:oleate hydratase [Legionella brunensis]|uniref:Amine oxidase domain-containing protein n=1 Tax=Legionella brunensis TaxID=29422 RepID=A0A0W0SKT8_9GAMM|nr:oleate hydratase [Legionella brunensis]KTC84034.1 hypothetical protein Lbru_1395 [Legionella brunensis]